MPFVGDGDDNCEELDTKATKTLDRHLASLRPNCGLEGPQCNMHAQLTGKPQANYRAICKSCREGQRALEIKSSVEEICS
jgi:hypothetical protein